MAQVKKKDEGQEKKPLTEVKGLPPAGGTFSIQNIQQFVAYLRVIKPGGHLIILVPEKERWQKALDNGQPPNLAHKHEGKVGELTALVGQIGGFQVVMDLCPRDDDYTILFVARRVG